jgi:hypothetical protein
VVTHSLGWSKDPGPPQAGDSPATFCLENNVSRQLSVFIDESGDFGSYQPHSPYYLVTMLLHDQNMDISPAIDTLDRQVINAGFEPHAIHTGPIVRREEKYHDSTIDERKKLLAALINFSRNVNVSYSLLRVDKRVGTNIIELTAKLSKQIQLFVNSHLSFFLSFDEIVVYYDNGQIELTRILTSTLTVLLSNVTFRRVKPSDYKLFQLADMFCSLELTALKFETNTVSRSEVSFFHSKRDFSKNYLKSIRRKRL